MDAPKIKTALPRRRYQMGEFTAVILADIEPNEPVEYRYILAVIRDGSSQPSFYVTLEKNRRSESVPGSHRMRVIAENYDEVVGSSDRWQDLDAFTTEALGVAASALGLTDEQPLQLM